MISEKDCTHETEQEKRAKKRGSKVVIDKEGNVIYAETSGTLEVTKNAS